MNGRVLQDDSKFCDCGQNPMVLPFKWNLFSNTFLESAVSLHVFYAEVLNNIIYAKTLISPRHLGSKNNNNNSNKKGKNKQTKKQ